MFLLCIWWLALSPVDVYANALVCFVAENLHGGYGSLSVVFCFHVSLFLFNVFVLVLFSIFQLR